MPDETNAASRRRFLKTSVVGAGLTTLTTAASNDAIGAPIEKPIPRMDRLPREVWIATVSQNGLRAKDVPDMASKMLTRMEEVAPFEPDVICLPEAFHVTNLAGEKRPLADVSESPIGEISRPFAEFARKHNCYVVCPIYTKHDDRYFNTAVFIDRQGELLGEYHKIYPTTDEMQNGVSPGPLAPPVFKTDFGVVGAQICFDIEYDDSWKKLQQAGAEVVFWPSAFAGGAMVNAKAWQNKFCVVSSTRKNTSKICDITGEEVTKTSHWNHWACAPVNLEKTFLHTWPYVRRFGDIHAKYGRDVRIRTFAEEEWSIIESRSPNIKIADIMKEFELLTHEEHIRSAEAEQCDCR